MRQTSIDAYRTIQENGLLTKIKWKIYDRLYHYGPLTTRQLFNGMKSLARDIGCVSPSIPVMVRMGVVDEAGTTICEETGKEVTLWDVTKRLPIKLEKPKRKKCPHCRGRGFTEEVQSKLF